MNLIDIAVLIILALYVAYGYYRGFLHSVISIGLYMVTWIFAMLFMPLLSGAIKGDETLYNMMLYYTEGSEYINDVELAKTQVAGISTEQLNTIIEKAELPYPMGIHIKSNVATEAFADAGVSTLGDYFNQTMVSVVVNILTFIILFIAIRLLLAFVLNGVDYASSFPKLRHSDGIIGAGFGVIRGVLALFFIFSLTPIILTVLPFEFIKQMIEDSFFSPFFYNSNLFLSMMPGVI